MGLAKELLETIEDIQEYYFVLDLHDMDLNEDFEDIDEGAGNLKGLSKHILKQITHLGGGEHSDVTVHGANLKNAAEVQHRLGRALKAGQVGVVFHNGKPISAIHPHTGYDKGMNIHTAESPVSHKKWEYGGKRRGSYERETPVWAHRDALAHVGYMTDKHVGADDYKGHHIEVKGYSPDTQRAAKNATRDKNRPSMQTNYVKRTPAEYAAAKKKDYWASDHKVTSKTPAGDLSKYKHAAAVKLATQKLGDKGSPLSKAQKLHAELGKHLESGNHKEASRVASELEGHIRRSGISKEDSDINRYARSLERGGRGDEWEKRNRAEMRKEREK
jgi:hypothetical protein